MNLIIKVFSVLALFSYTYFVSCKEEGDKSRSVEPSSEKIIVAAEDISAYVPYLKNKRIGLLVNQTSMVGNTHLVDTLLKLNIDIKKIFSPEHGFRGQAEAGETINSTKDSATKLPIVSLYGKNKKPGASSLEDIDAIVFDVQDVGTRFFTYISTMHYLMEACAEYKKELIILDRPNPHGSCIDGPVLEKKQKSFVGMHPIPICHGLTVGELAEMINGEGWLDSARICSLKIFKVKNYSHKKEYILPVKPSPNLPNHQSVKLYPSLCLFEGTSISVGRGTTFPFQVAGGIFQEYGSFQFVPKSIPGMAKNPMHEGIKCYGIDLQKAETPGDFTLKYVIDFYKISPEKDKYFNSFFDKLAGNEKLKEQIAAGLSEEEIRKTWQAELNRYKLIRNKYLLYKD